VAGRCAILIANGYWPRTPATTADAIEFPWIELCLREIERRSAGADYEVHVWDSTGLPEHLEAMRRYDRVHVWESGVEINPGARLSHRSALDELVARVGDDVEYVLFLDSDAFPVTDGWIQSLIATLDQGPVAIGILRDEQAPEIPPFIHVSCLCVRREVLAASGVTFGGGGDGDEPSLRLTEALVGQGLAVAAMHRTNAVEAHPILAGLYADLVYHHGAGSRPAWFYGTEDQGGDERMRVLLRRAVFDDVDHLVEVLRGRADNDIWPEAPGRPAGTAPGAGAAPGAGTAPETGTAPAGAGPSAPETLDPEMAAFYGRGTELGRLENQNPLEFLRTKIILEERLPPGGRLIDVGGGPGTYASWFAGRGYEVDLVDPIPLHVEQARQAAGRGAPFAVHLGDARKLGFDDGVADAVVMMGPLFHLVRAEDRRQALAETFRVLRPGGVLATSAMGRYFIFGHAVATNEVRNPLVVDRIASMVETGERPASWGPFDAHAHRAEELGDEVRAAGYEDVEVLAIEAFFHLLGDVADRLADPASRDGLLTLLHRFETDPGLVDFSGHLMAVGRKPGASGASGA
jgi:SAM-dependent methyltransferase